MTQTGGAETAAEPATRGLGGWVVVRRVLLVVLVLGTLVWSVAPGLPQVCRDAVADTTVVRVCEPLSVSDPPVILFLLVLALLVFPELSELELAGVLTLRRRLDAVREEAAELRSEIAHIRTQATAVSQAVASSHNAINVNVRQQQTGAALEEAREGVDGVFDSDEETGAFAQLAFESGFAGLLRLLPSDGDGASIIGYTVADEGRLEPTHFTAVVSHSDLDALTDLVNGHRPPATRVTQLDDGLAVLAFARTNAGLVGALMVRVPETGEASPASPEALAAGAEVAAGTYARLLVDLLGERPVGDAGASSVLVGE